MARAADRPARRRGTAEAGFTLIELTITTALLLLIAAAAFSLLAAAQRTQDFVGRRGQTQDQARTQLDRLSRELRDLTTFNQSFPSTGSPPTLAGASTGTLDFSTYTPASQTTPVRVVWSTASDGKGGYDLRRREGSSGIDVVVLGGLESANVFSWAPPGDNDRLLPYRIQVQLTLRGTNPTAHFSLSSDVQLRNVQIPTPPQT
jgi:prepilin-type N-terminal cleavage/methylation domain-containing protein